MPRLSCTRLATLVVILNLAMSGSASAQAEVLPQAPEAKPQSPNAERRALPEIRDYIELLKAEAQGLRETALQDSNRIDHAITVLQWIVSITAAVAVTGGGLLGFLITWFGRATKSQIEQEVAKQVAEQVSRQVTKQVEQLGENVQSKVGGDTKAAKAAATVATEAESKATEAETKATEASTTATRAAVLTDAHAKLLFARLPSELTMAADEVKQALDKNPTDRTLAILLGRLYRKQNKFTEAIQALSAFISAKESKNQRDKDYSDALYNRACYHSRLWVASNNEADRVNCLADLKASVQISPENKRDARADQDFTELHNDDNFKKLVT